MDDRELRRIIARMVRLGGEPDDIEVKSGAGGYPRSVIDSIVAFANTAGGTVIIGIDEQDDFAVVGVDAPMDYRDALVAQARDGVEPPMSVDVEVVEVDGAQVLVVDVPEADPSMKPLHLRSKGPTTGALIRSGDGDRRMTAAEIGLLYAARTQPRFDRVLVDTTVEELDRAALARSLERIRSGAASLRTLEDDAVLVRVGVLADDHGTLRPTLAGLLVFGRHPQSFFPQLMVSFVAVDADPDARFADNVTIRGSIPVMVSETVAAVRRNLAVRTTVSGEGRAERLDYSLEAVREAVVNALLHRDYSPLTQGTQIQVELHPDRLVVTSPGGLYGPIAEDELGEMGLSSSRNAVLASLLSDAYIPGTDRLVAENRASGIPAMIREARRKGQQRPVFESRTTRFTVTMERSALLGPDTTAWLRRLGAEGIRGEHELALAMARTVPVTNEMLREWGVDRIEAGRVLRDLVERDLLVRIGGRRVARYALVHGADVASSTVAIGTSAAAVVDRAADRVVGALRDAGEASAIDLARSTGMHRNTVLGHLAAAIDRGEVAALGVARSPRRRYRLVEHRPTGEQ